MKVVASLALLASLAIAAPAHADSFVVVHDDGTLAKSTSTPGQIEKELFALYGATGLPMPDVMSVWTTFPMMGNNYATFIDPFANDANGIGIPLSTSTHPPLRAILLHNNVLVMADRAAKSRAPVEGFSSYLFLLEFMHQWGPAVSIPAPGAGDLEGFPYHWSFFLESTSPDGGNHWTDNGDGTFTVVPRAPKDVLYSPLDLYLMGIGQPSEVMPFGILTNPTVPAMPTDPLWGGPFAGHSFPWFDTTSPPLTVTATRRVVSIDDIVSTNGMRDPAPVASKTFSVAIILVVPPNATDADVTSASMTFEPMAADLAPSFQRATSGRGTLDIVTISKPSGTGGAGGASPTVSSSASNMTPPKHSAPSGGCSCEIDERRNDAAYLACIAGMAAAVLLRRRRNVSIRRTSC
jgi:hypothetical protein